MEIQEIIEDVLKSKPEVKGYHGLEFWSAIGFCVLELHIFFDGFLNISIVHNIITDLEEEVRKRLEIKNLQEIIFHSEPMKGRTNGIIF